MELYQRIGYRRGQLAIASQLGHLKNIPALRDLVLTTEHWYKRYFNLVDEHDILNRAHAAGQHRRTALQRRPRRRAPQEQLLKYLNSAAQHYRRALALLPHDAINDLATIHGRLGALFHRVGRPIKPSHIT